MPRITELINRLPEKHDSEYISLGDILNEIEDRSLALIILVLTLPNIIPFINAVGITHVTGTLVLFFTAQMIFGAETPWLPEKLLNKKFKREKIRDIFHKSTDYLTYPEKIIKPRFRHLTRKKYHPLYGLILFTLTVILLLPLPFINVLPSLCMTCILLGLVQNDGVFAVGGLILSVLLAVALASGLYGVSIIALEHMNIPWDIL